MIQKFLIKAIPYIIIIILLIIGYFWIGSLRSDIKELNGQITAQSEVIKQQAQTIKDKEKDAQTAQKEQEKDKQDHEESQQDLIKYNETIEQFVENSSDDLVKGLNKYNECMAKNFNNQTNCLKLLEQENKDGWNY